MPCFAKVSSREDTSIIKDWTSKYSCWWLDQISEILALHFLHFPNIQHITQQQNYEDKNILKDVYSEGAQILVDIIA